MNNTTLAVQHVSFGYDNHSAVLNDITFHAEAGESIGLVGANGVGKSTLLKLLVGLHLPTSGSIQLDDWAVEPKNLPQIREKIGYVFQDSDSQLFMSTATEKLFVTAQRRTFSQTGKYWKIMDWNCRFVCKK